VRQRGRELGGGISAPGDLLCGAGGQIAQFRRIEQAADRRYVFPDGSLIVGRFLH
jgi:hypothetical protein